MPRKPPPAPAKGTRHPGAGRVKGKPNRISVELRTLVSELVTSTAYQYRLRQDFAARKVHPTIEALIWTYHLGKPKQEIALDARIDVNAKLDEERRLFASLEIRDLEDLAADSQRLIDKARALSARATFIETTRADSTDAESELTLSERKTLGKEAGSDNNGYVATSERPLTPDNSPDAGPTLPHDHTSERRATYDDDDDGAG